MQKEHGGTVNSSFDGDCSSVIGYEAVEFYVERGEQLSTNCTQSNVLKAETASTVVVQIVRFLSGFSEFFDIFEALKTRKHKIRCFTKISCLK
jgi:hypothetical protein